MRQRIQAPAVRFWNLRVRNNILLPLHLVHNTQAHACTIDMYLNGELRQRRKHGATTRREELRYFKTSAPPMILDDITGAPTRTT